MGQLGTVSLSCCVKMFICRSNIRLWSIQETWLKKICWATVFCNNELSNLRAFSHCDGYSVFKMRGPDTRGRFSATLYQWDNFFVTSCLISCTPIPLWKVVYLKRKEFAPLGSKWSILKGKNPLSSLFPIGSNVFPFSVDPFSERDKTIVKELPPNENVSILLSGCSLQTIK